MEEADVERVLNYARNAADAAPQAVRLMNGPGSVLFLLELLSSLREHAQDYQDGEKEAFLRACIEDVETRAEARGWPVPT